MIPNMIKIPIFTLGLPLNQYRTLSQYHNKSISKVKIGIFIIFGIISSDYFVNILVILPQITHFFVIFLPIAVDSP